MSELYELPDGWEWKKLEDVFLIERGGSPRPIKNYITDDKDGINWIKIGDTKKGEKYITQTAQKIKPEGLKKSRLVVEGDFLMSNSMSFGRPYIVKTKGAIHDGWLLMREKSDNTDKNFFYYLLSSNYMYEQFSAKASGTTVKNLNIGLVKTTNIPLPPLSEQQRIVSKLDNLFEKIDKSIALHQKNMKEADVFMGSVLDESFQELESFKNISLKSITTKIGSGSTPRGGQRSYKTEGISLIRSMNVHDTGFRKKGLAFIDDEQAKKLDNVTIQENDVLLNITGASVARCCIVDKNYLPARVNQHVSILRLKDKIIPSFLHYYLISPSVKSELLFSSSGGATREAITKSMLEKFQVPLISLAIQEKTVAYLNEISKKIEKIKSVQKEKMESLVALKASILDQAFRGEL